MASSQSQQQPAQSPFKLFSRASWTKGGKASKKASLGEENNMYYHPELKRWVEKGKEEEAEREAAGPPPPPVLSAASSTAAPLSKRSLSQRYVLQPNLSISSSMASLAGSLSQTDLASLVGPGYGDGSFSGPPSALGSTAPSPPQSSNCLLPQGYTPGPLSANALGSVSSSSFFVPAPPQRAASQPLVGFFMPPPPTPEDGPGEEAAGAEDGPGEAAGADAAQEHPQDGCGDVTVRTAGLMGEGTASAPPSPNNGSLVEADQSRSGGSGAEGSGIEAEEGAESQQQAANGDEGDASVAHAGGADVSASDGLVVEPPTNASEPPRSAAPPSLAAGPPCKEAADGAVTGHDGSVTGHDGAAAGHDGAAAAGRWLSYSDPLQEQQQAVTLSAASHPSTEGQQALMLLRREGRRLDGAGPNASDGGAAISLHEGMGVAPVQPHAHGGEVVAAGDDTLAEAAAAGDVEEEEEAELVHDGNLADAVVPEPVATSGAPATSVEPVSDDGGGAAAAPSDAAAAPAETAGAPVYSQYYYQQYAYLYQYALEQGYGEADAVTYAQYYAAAYAQQYETQAPEGQIGGGAAEDEGTNVVAVAADGPVVEAATVEAAEADAVVVEEAAVAEAAVEAAAVVVLEDSKAMAAPREEEDPVYFTAVPAAMATSAMPTFGGSTAPQGVLEPEVVPVVFSAAPLPADLAAAATAATHNHQSAVTAAVAAAAAAVGQPQPMIEPRAAAPREAGPGFITAAAAAAGAAHPTGPLGLMGLGAAGAKRFTQLSSAATAAVASLGATVAATAPVAAALSAATAAASTAAAAAAAAGMGFEGGMSEDDFERIMHPGDPAKLDGPLPWELPEHLRSGRKYLALCANWQLANPSLPYEPHLLLQQQIEALVAVQEAQQGELVVRNGSDVALAAEGGSGSGGGAVAAPPVQQPVEAEELSSYERACRLAQFGQPVPGLATQTGSRSHHSPDAGSLPPQQQQQQQLAATAVVEVAPAAQDEASALTAAAVQPSGPAAPEQRLPHAGDAAAAPVASPAVAAVAVEVQPFVPAAPEQQLSKRDDAAAQVNGSGQVLEQASSQVDVVPEQLTNGWVTLEEVTKESEAGEVAAEASVVPTPLAHMGTAEATSFFEELCDQAATPTAAEADTEVSFGSAVVAEQAVELAADVAVVTELAVEPVAAVAGGKLNSGVADVTAPAATAAAAAIDAVVQALEQLRAGAAAPNGDATATSQPDNTALLLQIHSSLAHATQALAGMGVDVSALASLASGAQVQTPAAPEEWTPATGTKRQRKDASPTTPTRPAAGVDGTEGVVTPLLAPGPPVARAVPEGAVGDGALAPGATAGERFQQLGRQLSNASAEAAAVEPDQSCSKVDAAQLQPVVVSLTVVAPPEVDVAAVEAQARAEERGAWATRLEAVVDSERESAALVIASVEQERDRLQLHVGDLEQKLATVQAERDVLVQRLECSEADARQALAAQAGAQVEHAALAANMCVLSAEREDLALQLAAERSEKAALTEALAASRSENSDLRRHYAERFSSLTSELEATRGSLAELQSEHDELLLCLGQESTKVAVLTDALRDTGCDPEPMLERIEAEYETMGLGAGEEQQEDAAEASEQPAEEGADEGWEGEDL